MYLLFLGYHVPLPLLEVYYMNKLTKGSNMRWESSRMTLPEHVEKILSWKNEQTKNKKPILDEQQMECINETLHIAIEYNLPVIFTLWIDGLFQEVEGSVHFIDQQNNRVHLVDISLKAHKIDFDSIASVEFAE